MRICFLTTSFPAHPDDIRSPFLLELCRALKKEHIDLDVISPRYEGTTAEDSMEGINVHRFSYFWPLNMQVLTQGGGIPSALKTSWLARLQFPLFFLAFLTRSLRYGKRCDIIHAQWSFSALIGLFLKWTFKKPLVMTERGASANLARNNWLMKKVLDFVVKRCDFVTANSLQQTELFVKLGVPKERTLTVLNGINTHRFKQRDKKTCRKKLNLPLNKKIVLFVGWLIERKNVESLIEAMSLVSKNIKNALCIIVGEGNKKKSLENLAREMNLEKVVHFTNQVIPSQVALYMNAADVFVLPSLSEGKPNVVAEAMASGTPVVATNVAGTKEIVHDGKNGLLVMPKNQKDLAKAITAVLGNPALAKKLSQQGLQTVHTSSLTWSYCAKQYIAIYNKIS